MHEEIRDYLRGASLPGDDVSRGDSSSRAFSDGGLFKWEFAGPVNAEVASRLFSACDERSVFLNQLTHTDGIMRMLDREIEDLVAVARETARQLVMAVGPRGVYDISAQRLAPGAAAQASAYRLRGVEQILRAVADVERGVSLGVRGFLIFDEGLLWLLSRMRAEGRLPVEVRFKASSAMGAGNPFHCRVIAELGADAVNLQRDLEIGMIAACRAAVSVPLDIHTDNPPSTGGFVRYYEISEFVRVAAPVYLKAGGSATEIDAPMVGTQDVSAIARELAVQSEILTRVNRDAVQSRSVDA